MKFTFNANRKKRKKIFNIKGARSRFSMISEKGIEQKKMQFNSTLAKWRHQYDIFFSVKIVEYVNFKDVELLKKKTITACLKLRLNYL